ncbi:DUF4912 domain-containing protein [Cyanobium sp. LEGE 06143]|uniref:DUF4912 domain-containing protein n=1 Tax=Cyanobium sp. LEGE 06143 TaxID=945727 RepID=UPI00187F6192|nr:DUF4912 domain-containing protein [Cyanobium sp. LEGE 06143]MBE9172280.1 DUF4912 domain-containing protein [Cyanobium sp. LEGE 06143]
MTLRQLRQIASDLGVTLYSRKSKDELVSEIGARKDDQPNEGFGQVQGSAASQAESPSLKSIEADMPPAPQPTAETSVVFLPRDPQWAYVFWDITEADRNAAFAAGANQLCLRLADVTGLSGGSAHPHTLQEVIVDSHATEWYLPVPLSDRDYRVELGYRKGSAGGWISLAFSSVARVPALHPSDQILDQFVPFTLETGSTAPAAISAAATPSTSPAGADQDLHERLYQSATSQWRQIRRGSEAFHELDTTGFESGGLNASGAGIWASGRSESGIGGVAPRQRSFWLVADAELIVYGATDPSAKLAIGGEDVPLSADGTFRVQVPFRDGRQIYPIEAVAADGDQSRNITLEFSRTTPEDNSNPADQAVAEWF